MNPPFFATPQETEGAFYRAFSQRDLAGMMAVWAEEDDIVCVHPGGRTVIGREAIRASWEEIFRNAPDMQFVVAEKQRSHGETLAVHVVHEHIRASGQLARPILATNVYRRTAGGWRMVLHHASPDSTEVPPPAEPQTLH